MTTMSLPYIARDGDENSYGHTTLITHVVSCHVTLHHVTSRHVTSRVSYVHSHTPVNSHVMSQTVQYNVFVIWHSVTGVMQSHASINNYQ